MGHTQGDFFDKDMLHTLFCVALALSLVQDYILLDIFHTTPQRHDVDKTKSYKVNSLCRRGVV